MTTDERLEAIFTRDDQITLLGNWSIGKHREDIADIEPFLFENKKLYEGVLQGLLPTQLATENLLGSYTSVAELMKEGTRDYSHAYYTEAKTNALIAQRAIYADKIKHLNKEDTSELIDKIKRTDAILNGEELRPLATKYGEGFISWIEEEINESNPKYGTGFFQLDQLTKGLHRGELTILGARPRVGKSAIALQIAYNVAYLQGYKVLFLPLEMTVNQCLERILLQTQTVDPDYRESLQPKDKENITDFLDSLEENLKFCSSLTRVEDIERTIKAEKPYLVIVDQLSHVQAGTKRGTLREQYVDATRKLKEIALDQNVSILCLHQMNRVSTDREVPTLENLAESDSTARDADNVLLMYADDDSTLENGERIRLTHLRVAKQRNGRGGDTIELMYRGETFTFSPCFNNR